jgi:hypothetical protein
MPNAYQQLGTFTCTRLGSQDRTPTEGGQQTLSSLAAYVTDLARKGAEG